MQKEKEADAHFQEKYIRWFSELGKKDVKEVGGKAANLGEMFNIGMPVPQGFAITASAYKYFLKETKLDEEIYSLLKIDVENTKKLDEITKRIREMIENAEMPVDMEKEIAENYEHLGFNKEELKNISDDALSILKKQEPTFVAVRSSATAEDSSEASFAGQQETFLNIKGKVQVIEAVKKCWASLFTARSVYYRIKKGFQHEKVLIAVVIQKMVNSDKSGVIFSNDPINENKNVIVEAVFGLGEGIVSGRIEPDHYAVSREEKIISKRIAEKKTAIVRNSAGKNEIVKLNEEKSRQQVLNEYETRKLANYAIKLEEHYKLPQDIEFAIDSNEIFIVQTRPITTLGKEKKEINAAEQGKEILSGMPASPGIGVGEVKIIANMKDLEKVRNKDVLVTEMTNPDMVVAMQKSKAIVTDEGGQTSHAAIVSREMGIPAIVGTKIATKILKDGMIISVDGFKGKVYEGKIKEEKKVEILPVIETKTRIKVMVDLPDFAERAALTKCKDVGLVRLEGIIAESGKHPLYFLHNGKINAYEKIIFNGISKIASFFNEIWVRTSDIRSDEYRHLEGSSEKIELNPMLGMHGIRFSLKNRKILEAELRAIIRVAEKKKVGIMMPQIISIDELREVKKMLGELTKEENKNIKLGAMIETPSAVQIIEELCKENIDFISFGTNDLTQYTLAVDRGNEDCQYLYNEMHPAILAQLKQVIEICKKYNVETSICGQAGSKKEMVEFLVRQGINSISVNADKANEISRFVRELEEKGMRGKDTEIKRAQETEIKKENREADEIVKEVAKEIRKEAGGKNAHKINCHKCKKEAYVPFIPDGVRPVYCKECFKNARIKKNDAEENKESFYNEESRKIIETGKAEEAGAGEEKKEIKREEYPDNEIEFDVFSHEGNSEKSFYEEESKEIISGKEEETLAETKEKMKAKAVEEILEKIADKAEEEITSESDEGKLMENIGEIEEKTGKKGVVLDIF